MSEGCPAAPPSVGDTNIHTQREVLIRTHSNTSATPPATNNPTAPQQRPPEPCGLELDDFVFSSSPQHSDHPPSSHWLCVLLCCAAEAPQTGCIWPTVAKAGRQVYPGVKTTPRIFDDFEPHSFSSYCPIEIVPGHGYRTPAPSPCSTISGSVGLMGVDFMGDF